MTLNTKEEQNEKTLPKNIQQMSISKNRRKSMQIYIIPFKIYQHICGILEILKTHNKLKIYKICKEQCRSMENLFRATDPIY